MFCNIIYFLCLSIIFISLHCRYVFPGPNQSRICFLNTIQSTTKCSSTAGVRSSLAFPYGPAPAVLYFLSFLGRAGQIWPWLHSSAVARLVLPQCTALAQLPQQTQGSELVVSSTLCCAFRGRIGPAVCRKNCARGSKKLATNTGSHSASKKTAW